MEVDSVGIRRVGGENDPHAKVVVSVQDRQEIKRHQIEWF